MVVNHEIPVEMIEEGTPPPELIYRRRLSYKKAYQCVQKKLTSDFKYADPSWAKEALAHLEEEKERLENFFKESPEPEERNKRIAELMARAKPRIQVRPLRGAFLYLPQFTY